jgi:hypothetical protein
VKRPSGFTPPTLKHQAAVMGRDELRPVAQDAARRLQTVLDTLAAGA